MVDEVVGQLLKVSLLIKDSKAGFACMHMNTHRTSVVILRLAGCTGLSDLGGLR